MDDRAGHLLLASVVLVSSLGVVAVNEAQMIEGAGGGADGDTGGLTYRLMPQIFLGLTDRYSHNTQSFGGQEFLIERHLVQLSRARAV